ncbi:DUF3575 domain-containing protein [Massilibacteroides sp.]|uniref:DUF3575 domain-containing protein n=1 Tax=Massilibacteroides sp. TaxID=2034766 RepID=UPI00261416B3|nr:DUF3575 domain-containing protein [Massilibacteroides sp.]MDD4516875.1 DUF3575 domain-containing protein [Massilibacteroides sp.]
MLKHFFFIVLFIVLSSMKGYGQTWAVKINLPEIITTTFNLGTEVRLSEQYSLNLTGSLNPWTFSENRKFQHWIIRPEGRYWLDKTFNGHFFGVHAFHGRFNAGGISILGLKKERREGNFTGGGFSYGYLWHLSGNWNLEATAGLGYAYQDYKRFACEKCGESKGKGTKNYIGPTNIGVNLIYAF